MHRIILSLILFFFIGFKAFSQTGDVPLLIKQGIDLVNSAKEEAALEKFMAALKSDPNNYEATWHTSLLYSLIGNRQKDEDQKKNYFLQAKQYAAKALKLNAVDAEANYAMAVAMGRMALISGSKDKVAASRDIKNYADLAVKYNPNHAGAWHVLGKWNYEVASLNFAERLIANSLFGGLPSGADMPEAIKCYKKAISLNPNYILYYYDLAVAYDENDEDNKAVETLNKALLLSPKTEDDPDYIKQCRQLLNKLK